MAVQGREAAGPTAVRRLLHEYGVHTPNLASRLRVSAAKVRFYFEFHGAEGLTPIRGGRAIDVYYSQTDYEVVRQRQVSHGATGIG